MQAGGAGNETVEEGFVFPGRAGYMDACCMCPLYDTETGEITGWTNDVPNDPAAAAAMYRDAAEYITQREQKVWFAGACARVRVRVGVGGVFYGGVFAKCKWCFCHPLCSLSRPLSRG